MKIGAITLSITPEYIARLLSYMREQTRKPDYSILVANSPRVQQSGIHQSMWDVIFNPGFNVSFSLGNNMAAAEMPRDITHLLLLNDDLLPMPDFVQRLVEAAETTSADIIGAKLVHRDGRVNHAGGCEIDVERALSEHIGRGEPSERWTGIAITPWVTFAAVLIKRALWNTLGGLDESFVYGYEDHDYCLRAIELGAKIVVARDATAIHEECGTRPRGGLRDAANYDIFSKRWAGEALRGTLAAYLGEFPDAEGIPK